MIGESLIVITVMAVVYYGGAIVESIAKGDMDDRTIAALVGGIAIGAILATLVGIVIMKPWLQ